MSIQQLRSGRSQPQEPATAPRQGTVSLFSVIIIVALIGVVGLGLDTALVMTARQQLQRSADAAALAAAALLREPGQDTTGVAANYQIARRAAQDTAAAASNDIVRCGQAGIALADNFANADDDVNQVGDIVLGAWRFDTGTNQFAFVRTDMNTGLPVPDAVKVRAQCASGSMNSQLELMFGATFGSIFGSGANNVSNVGRASIAKLGRPDDPLILVLHRTQRGSLLFDGGVIMDVRAGTVQVDSSHGCAFNVNGSIGIMEAQRTRVVGGACLTPSNLTGDLIEGSPYVPDPLAGLAAPSTIGMPNRGGITAAGTYDPGYYPDGINMNGGIARLNPGIYVFGNNAPAKGIDLKGDAFLEGERVLLYMEPGAAVNTGGSGAGMRLTPMISGTYWGVTVFMARTGSADAVITGGGVFDVKGTFYVPNGDIEMRGDVTRLVGRIIVDTLTVRGNSTFVITGDDLPPPEGPLFVYLVN